MRNLSFYVKKLAAGSLAMSLEKASQNLVGLILLPVFAIFLSPEDFGILSMFALVVALLGLIYNPGTVSAAVRLYFDTKDEKKRKEIFASTNTFFLLMPIPVTIIISLLGHQLFKNFFTEFDFMPYGFLGVLLAYFSQPKRIWAEFMIVKYKVVQMAGKTFIAFLLGAAVSVICIVLFDMGVMGRIIGLYVAPVMLFVISLITLRKYSKGMTNLKTMAEVVRFGLPLTGAIWAYSLLQYTGVYLIERYLNLDDVGIYNIAYRLAGIPLFITLGFRQMWNPVFYENMQNRNYETITRLMSLFILIMTLLCGFTILFSKELIILLFDERYLQAITVMGWVVMGIFLLGLLPLSNSFLGYAKKFALTSWIALTAAAVNIVLNIWFIPLWGIRGAAFALIISYAIYFGSGVIFSYRDFAKVADFKALLMTVLLFVPSLIYVEKTLSSNINFYEIVIKSSMLIIWVTAVFKFRFMSIKEIKSFFNAVIQRLKQKNIKE